MGIRDMKQEFRDLLQASGWTQAEAARQLAMTSSALSQIVRENSPVNPSPVTLRLFQLLLLREKPAALRRLGRRRPALGAEQWERDVILALRAIPPPARAPILDALEAMIEAALARKARAGRRLRKKRQGKEKG